MSENEIKMLAELREKELAERRGHLMDLEYTLRCGPYPDDAQQYMRAFIANPATGSNEMELR